MQLIADFLPLLLFLAGYLYEDLYFAVKVLMFAMPVGLVLKTVITRKLDKVYLASTAFLLIMGGATIAFRNPLFLYWKPTVFYWVMALVFAGSLWIGDKPIAQRMFAKVGQLSDQQWISLNIVWAVFFAAVGALNIFIAYGYSEEFWVNFKVFGLTAITFVFVIAQAVWMSKFMHAADSDNNVNEAD